jgi:putative ABC transport system substrate-binding protein
MRRRYVLIALGTATVAPRVGSAQQPKKLVRIGVLSPAERTDTRVFAGLRQGLRELGYVEGRNIAIEYRLTAGDFTRLPAMAAELAALPVDIIVTDGGDRITQIALDATRTIPIVTPTNFDPVTAGFAASFARPGGTVTGLTMLAIELCGKRVQLLKEAFPSILRVAALWNPAAAMSAQLDATEAAARDLGLQLYLIKVATPDQLAGALGVALAGAADALVVLPDAMYWNERGRIVALAAQSRVPAIYPEREYADDGGTLAYGPNVADNFRRAAAFIDKILKGEKPGDLPIQQPVKFEFVVNLKTVRALDLTVPQALLARADEVIE